MAAEALVAMGRADAVKVWSEEELIDRAVTNGDEHAIKFTEACLREYTANPKPIYLAAAFDIANRLG